MGIYIFSHHVLCSHFKQTLREGENVRMFIEQPVLCPVVIERAEAVEHHFFHYFDREFNS